MVILLPSIKRLNKYLTLFQVQLILFKSGSFSQSSLFFSKLHAHGGMVWQKEHMELKDLSSHSVTLSFPNNKVRLTVPPHLLYLLNARLYYEAQMISDLCESFWKPIVNTYINDSYHLSAYYVPGTIRSL